MYDQTDTTTTTKPFIPSIWGRLHEPKARFYRSDIGIVSDGRFSYRISDIGGDIKDTRAYRAFILDTIYNEILITKSWFSVIDIIYNKNDVICMQRQ